MANGICVYAESYNGELETVAAELVSAAKGLTETTKEKQRGYLPCAAFLCAGKCFDCLFARRMLH